MKILNKTKGTVIAQQVDVADTAISRAVGLLNRSSLPYSHGLLITHCSSIHMFFMRFAIDAIFVNKHDHVVGCVKGIKPFRLSPCFWRASYVIELPVGAITESQTEIGDSIEQIQT